VVIRALEQGAIDFLPKAPAGSADNSVLSLKRHLVTLFHQFHGRRNLNLAKRISSGGTHRRLQGASLRGPEPADPSDPGTGTAPLSGVVSSALNRVQPRKPDLVVISASTGGPNALSEVIPRLPADLGVPVLVVQHMPSFLTFSLARSLNDKSPLRVHEAAEGELLRPGTVYVAPGGRHLLLRSRRGGTPAPERTLALGDGPPENSVRPSADVLFRSVAEVFEGHVLAVIMTGMGNDGMRGVQALKSSGCYCITQTAETCVVYGMPRAVDEAGLSDESADLEALAERIAVLVKGSPAKRIA
jgi:two-component system chemotaxis response regulator CheB